MKWWPGLAVAVVGLAGCCQTPRGPSDPFLRTTVPPPQTGQFAPPPGNYYTPGVAAAPAGTPGVVTPGALAPAYGGAPANSPPSYGGPPPAGYNAPPPATYGAPPTGAPDGAPATAPNRYAPPGAFNYPQSSIERSKAVDSGLAASRGAGPTLARNSAARSRLIGGSQPASPASGAEVANNSDAAPDDTDSAAIAAPAVAIVPRTSFSAVEQASYAEPADDAGAAAGDSASAPIGTAASAAVSGASSAVASPAAIASANVPEISDLPAATGSDTLRAYGASRSRLVFTRANRPLSSTAAPANVAAASADNGLNTSPANTSPANTDVATSSAANNRAESPVARGAGSSGAKYAVADDYGTLYGKLEYSQARKQWKLRYIPIDGQTDNYGGSVLLADAGAVENFHPGDFVVVRGQVASAGTKQGFAPEYDLRQIAAQ